MLHGEHTFCEEGNHKHEQQIEVQVIFSLQWCDQVSEQCSGKKQETENTKGEPLVQVFIMGVENTEIPAII